MTVAANPVPATGRIGRWLSWTFAFAVVTSVMANADTVTLIPPRGDDDGWYARPTRTISGAITRFDDRVCEIDGVRHRAIDVLHAEPDAITPEAATVLTDPADPVRELMIALEQRPPVWWQQILTAHAADDLMRIGRRREAYELIRQLDARPLPPLVVTRLPVAWSSDDATDTHADDAAGLTSESPLVRLVAASRLSDHPSHRSDARRSLAELAGPGARPIERPMIRSAARAVQIRIVDATPLRNDPGRVVTAVDRFPVLLRPAAAASAADALERIGRDDEAREMRLRAGS